MGAGGGGNCPYRRCIVSGVNRQHWGSEGERLRFIVILKLYKLIYLFTYLLKLFLQGPVLRAPRGNCWRREIVHTSTAEFVYAFGGWWNTEIQRRV